MSFADSRPDNASPESGPAPAGVAAEGSAFRDAPVTAGNAGGAGLAGPHTTSAAAGAPDGADTAPVAGASDGAGATPGAGAPDNAGATPGAGAPDNAGATPGAGGPESDGEGPAAATAESERTEAGPAREGDPLARLDRVPLAEHPAIYEQLHGELQAALADIDGA